MIPRAYFVILGVWLALAVVLAVNIYHYARAVFAGVSP